MSHQRKHCKIRTVLAEKTLTNTTLLLSYLSSRLHMMGRKLSIAVVIFWLIGCCNRCVIGIKICFVVCRKYLLLPSIFHLHSKCFRRPDLRDEKLMKSYSTHRKHVPVPRSKLVIPFLAELL